jgi:16S rRNA (cytosine967-C5)-methyltransferase
MLRMPDARSLPPRPSPSLSPARQAALRVLSDFDRQPQPIDHLLAAAGRRPLSDRDRALAHALVYGVLRWRRRLDGVIARHSKRPLAKIDGRLLNVLRIGLFQILLMERIPASAAVNTAVELAKATAGAWSGGFVNGILRSVLRDPSAPMESYLPADPLARLGVEASFPDWMLRRWAQRLGLDEARRMCQALNQLPPMVLRTNTLRTPREALLSALAPRAEAVRPTAHARDGVRLEGVTASFIDTQAFRDGWFQVQDEAAQLVGELVAPQKGETVLDACAGLGGKTGHLAQMMANQGSLWAADREAHKLQTLAAEMERLGVSMVTPKAVDWQTASLADGWPRFHRVLVDAPCSGLGVIRRHPDAKWNIDKRNLAAFGQRQLDLLGRLAPLVRPGGLLVYAVCSLEPEETREVVEGFRERFPEWAVDRDLTEVPPAVHGLLDPQGCLDTRPLLETMDGFFAVRLRRTG